MVVMALASFVEELHAQETYELGDLDGDGVPTVRDIALMAGHFNGISPLSETDQLLADVNQDGTVNQADMDELTKEILGTRDPESLPLSTVRFTSPASGEADVAVTRETTIHFTVPLALDTTLDTDILTAEFGGKKILSRVELAGDRKKATLFYLEPLPSNARIRLTLDSSELTDLLGRPFDGDGDGEGGGNYEFYYDTLSITPVGNTSISGRVFASERATGGLEVPLAGVTITVDGAEETLRTTTDAQGNFTLSPSPAGSFFVKIDGRTSPQSSWPNGDYYPLVGKKWYAVAGRTDNLSGDINDTDRGNVYLPCVCAGTLQTVSQTQDTVINFPPEVLASNPELAGTEIVVPANALFSDEGIRGGQVGIAPVAPDRLPSPLPPGLDLPMVITIQSDGATNFDQPVPVCLPNLPDPETGETLAPGEKSALWSFDHDTGTWEIAGSMTVTDDGLFVKTDPGVGVREPGWHGQVPGTTMKPSNQDPCDIMDNLNRRQDAQRQGIGSAASAASSAADAIYGRGSRFADADLGKGIRRTKKALDTASSVMGEPGSDSISDTASGLIRDAVSSMSEFANQVNNLGKDIAAALPLLDSLNDMLDANEASEDAWNDYYCCNNFGRPCIPGTRIPQPIASQDRKNLDNLQNSTEELAMVGSDVVPKLDDTYTNVDEAMNNLEQSLNEYEQDPTSVSKADEVRERLSEATNEINSSSTIASAPRFDLILDEVFERNYDVYYFRSLFLSDDSSASSLSSGKILHWLLSSDNDSQRHIIPSNSNVDFILSPDSLYRISVCDPLSNSIGAIFLRTSGNGESTGIPPIVLEVDQSEDEDNDGINTASELVIGTDPENADSDSDGISDGQEIRNGTDPLSGLTVRQGVIAGIPTLNTAMDICASNNLAAIAMGSSGVSIFNVFSGLNPTRILDVDTQGNASSVSCGGDYVCVADGPAGLAVIDVGDAANIELAYQVALGSTAGAVVIDGVVAYVGTGRGEIISVDLATGLILEQVSTSGSTPEDLRIVGDVLYVLDSNRLRAFSIGSGPISELGSLPVSLFRGNMNLRFRLFADGQVAYCTHSRGYSIVDISDPENLQLVQAVSDNQFGWKQVIANGSGLGIVASSPNSTPDGPHHISLYDFGEDGRGTDFVTTIETPGIARAVSVYNGFAYVADDSQGLQVINYLPFDGQGVPPTITLASNFNLNEGAAEEGKRMRLSASVTDDVQVQNVEFYVDGELAATDGNYPFEHAFLAPDRTIEKTTFTVQAKATDTGGNMTWTDELTLDLIPDATPPVVTASSPRPGSLVGSISQALVTFNEPMAVSTLNSGISVTLGGSPIGATVTYRESSDTAFIVFDAPLEPGSYSLGVQSPASDAAGNVIASPYSASFQVFSLQDDDIDGLSDDWEPLLGLDPTKDDTDGNGILDGEEDFDDDGLSNGLEILLGFDPTNSDSNGNGVPDGEEDTDLEGLTDGEEILLGTDPNLPDTDNDTWSDEAEVSAGSDPLNPRSRPYPFMMSQPRARALHIGNPGEGLLTTVGNPKPLTAVNFGAGAGDGSGAFIRANPPVTVVNLGGGSGNSAQATLQAKPSVTVLRLSNSEDESMTEGVLSSGSMHAAPPVTVIRDYPNSIRAQPPVTVERQE